MLRVFFFLCLAITVFFEHSFATEAPDEEKGWRYQRHQRKSVRHYAKRTQVTESEQRQQPLLKKVEKQETALRQKDIRRQKSNLYPKRSVESLQPFSSKTKRVEAPRLPPGLTIPRLQLPNPHLSRLAPPSRVTKSLQPPRTLQISLPILSMSGNQSPKKQKIVVPDDPVYEHHILPERWIRTLKKHATHQDPMDLCTLILRPWDGVLSKKAFLSERWNTLKNASNVSQDLWQSFAQFLLCKRCSTQKGQIQRMRAHLQRFMSRLSENEQPSVIRYHLAIDTIDGYRLSKVKEKWDVGRLYAARKTLKELGKRYPIAAHYYAILSLESSLKSLWASDPNEGYNQRALYNLYEHILSFGFSISYKKSLLTNELDLTSRQKAHLRALFDQKLTLTPVDRHAFYEKFIERQSTKSRLYY